MMVPGDEIRFDREPGDFWAFVEDAEAPPAPPGIVRVTTADPRDFAGHRALVVQQVPWQSVPVRSLDGEVPRLRGRTARSPQSCTTRSSGASGTSSSATIGSYTPGWCRRGEATQTTTTTDQGIAPLRVEAGAARSMYIPSSSPNLRR